MLRGERAHGHGEDGVEGGGRELRWLGAGGGLVRSSIMSVVFEAFPERDFITIRCLARVRARGDSRRGWLGRPFLHPTCPRDKVQLVG